MGIIRSVPLIFLLLFLISCSKEKDIFFMNNYVGKSSDSNILVEDIEINSISHEVSEETAVGFMNGRNFFIGFDGKKGDSVLVRIKYSSNNYKLEKECRIPVNSNNCAGFVYIDGDVIRCDPCDSVF